MMDDGRAASEARSRGLTTGVGEPPEIERARGSVGDKIDETGEGAKVPGPIPGVPLLGAGWKRLGTRNVWARCTSAPVNQSRQLGRSANSVAVAAATHMRWPRLHRLHPALGRVVPYR